MLEDKNTNEVIDGNLGIFENTIWESRSRRCAEEIGAITAINKAQLLKIQQKKQQAACELGKLDPDIADSKLLARAHNKFFELVREEKSAQQQLADSALVKVKKRQLIFAFRGTFSTENIKTDVDSSQVSTTVLSLNISLTAYSST